MLTHYNTTIFMSIIVHVYHCSCLSLFRVPHSCLILNLMLKLMFYFLKNYIVFLRDQMYFCDIEILRFQLHLCTIAHMIICSYDLDFFTNENCFIEITYALTINYFHHDHQFFFLGFNCNSISASSFFFYFAANLSCS